MDTVSNDSAGNLGLQVFDNADIIFDRQNRNGSALVVNGDSHIRKHLAAILDKMGYDVVVSMNGEKALNKFLKGSFDIVFTGLKMPGMDGLTLSLQIKAASLNTPVVLIFDEYIENFMNRIKAGRIDCVIFKPFGSGEIQEAVQYFLRTRRYKKTCPQ